MIGALLLLGDPNLRLLWVIATLFLIFYAVSTLTSYSVLAIIGKRRFVDFGRAGGVADMAELEAQILEIAAGSRMVQEFVNDGLVVG